MKIDDDISKRIKSYRVDKQTDTAENNTTSLHYHCVGGNHHCAGGNQLVYAIEYLP